MLLSNVAAIRIFGERREGRHPSVSLGRGEIQSDVASASHAASLSAQETELSDQSPALSSLSASWFVFLRFASDSLGHISQGRVSGTGEERRGDITPHPHPHRHTASPSLTLEVVAALWHYLYHDVDVLGVLQQAEVGVDVEPVILGVGVGQDHLALPQGLQEGLVPLRPLIRQQLPLKERTTQLEVTRVVTVPTAVSKTVMRKDFCRIFAFRTEAEWSDAGLEDTLHLSVGSFDPECARKRASLSIYCWLADWLID